MGYFNFEEEMRNAIYIIAGGSSLKNFPFYKLEGLDTIAVNEAALDVPNPTYCITADSKTFRKIQEGYFKKVDTTWVLVSNPNHASMNMQGGRFVHRRSGFVYDLFSVNMVIKNAGTDGIGFSFKDFKTGYNSGFCAFQLAVLLRYKKIYLLGVDLVSGIQSHYHNRYKGKKIAPNTLDKFYNNFALALDIIKKETDIKVVSCSSISRLNSIIPYEPFETEESKPVTMKSEDCPKKLSILICSIAGREASLNKLLGSIKKQMNNQVEVLVKKDNQEISVGAKRNILLKKARGEYICFVDDDDMISDDYVSKILKALKSGPDCCSLEGRRIQQRKGGQQSFFHSLTYSSWYKRNGVYYRSPNHLNTVRRSLALQVKFLDKNTGEDHDYSKRLLPLLKTEKPVKGVIYYYLTG